MKSLIFCITALAGASAAGAAAFAAQPITLEFAAMRGSGELGTAKLTEKTFKQPHLTIDLAVNNTNTIQPASIHAGTCAHFSAQPAYLLQAISGGKSSTDIPGQTIAALKATPYAIIVSKSFDARSSALACAQIE